MGDELPEDSVMQFLDGLDWETPVGGGTQVCMVTNFLKSMGRDASNAPQRVAAWKRFLPASLRPFLKQLPLRPGKEPWTGTRSVLKVIYKHLKKKRQ